MGPMFFLPLSLVLLSGHNNLFAFSLASYHLIMKKAGTDLSIYLTSWCCIFCQQSNQFPFLLENNLFD